MHEFQGVIPCLAGKETNFRHEQMKIWSKTPNISSRVETDRSRGYVNKSEALDTSI